MYCGVSDYICSYVFVCLCMCTMCSTWKRNVTIYESKEKNEKVTKPITSMVVSQKEYSIPLPYTSNHLRGKTFVVHH